MFATRFKQSYHVYAIATIVFWSLAYVLTRLALRSFSPLPLGFLRYLIASSTLAVVALVTKMRLPNKRDWPLLLASGALGFFVYMIAFNKGSQTVCASTSSLIIATVPVLTALLARVLFGERLRPLQWVAIAVEFMGIVLLTLLNGVLSINTGVLWMLLAAAALCGYNLLQRKLTKTIPALASTAYSIFAGTLLLAVFAPASIPHLRQAQPAALAYLAVLGVFSGALAYVCWSKAFEKAPKTGSVSNYMFVTPFLTSLLGFLLAGEIPDLATTIGGAVILLGVLVFQIGGKQAAEKDDKLTA